MIKKTQPKSQTTSLMSSKLMSVPSPPNQPLLPHNSVIRGLKAVNSNESRELLPDDNSTKKHEPQKSTSDAPPKTPSCKFYLQGRCRHGRQGKDCSFVHPPLCHKFIKMVKIMQQRI